MFKLLINIFRCVLLISITAVNFSSANVPQLPPTPKFQNQLFYLDNSGHNWVYIPVGSGETIISSLHGKKEQIPTPENGSIHTGICPSHSFLWACVIENHTSDSPTMAVLRWDLQSPRSGWVRVGQIDDHHGVPSLIVPLEKEGFFLGISMGMGFLETQPPRASLAARFRLKDDRFQFVECVEMTLDGIGSIAKRILNSPEYSNSTEGSGGTTTPFQLASCVVEPSALRPTLECPSISPSHLAISATQSGVIWFFELKNGNLLRTCNLDGLNKDELSKVKLLNHSILGTAFDASGCLFVAKRNRELSQIAVKLVTKTTDPIEEKLQEADFQFYKDYYKDITWIELDSITGSRKNLDSIADYPIMTPSFRKQNQLKFLVTFDGQIKTNAYREWGMIKRDFGISVEDTKVEKNDTNSISKPELKQSITVDKNSGGTKTLPIK